MRSFRPSTRPAPEKVTYERKKCFLKVFLDTNLTLPYPSFPGRANVDRDRIEDDDHMLYTPTYKRPPRSEGVNHRPNRPLINALHGKDTVVLYHNPHFAVGLPGSYDFFPCKEYKNDLNSPSPKLLSM